MNVAQSNVKVAAVAKGRRHEWILWLALGIAGVMLLADAYNWTHLDKWTARLGITLIYSAFALLMTGGKTVGYLSSGIVVIALVATFLL